MERKRDITYSHSFFLLQQKCFFFFSNLKLKQGKQNLLRRRRSSLHNSVRLGCGTRGTRDFAFCGQRLRSNQDSGLRARAFRSSQASPEDGKPSTAAAVVPGRRRPRRRRAGWSSELRQRWSPLRLPSYGSNPPISR
nr:hypothetical protein Itr_chr08CG04950 [Ipomoea trifida]